MAEVQGYRPRAVSHAIVVEQLTRGGKIRTAEQFRRSEGVVCPPVRALTGDPPVIAQPFEPIPKPGTYTGSLWLWSDGTLRNAPEYVVAGGPYDRVWIL